MVERSEKGSLQGVESRLAVINITISIISTVVGLIEILVMIVLR